MAAVRILSVTSIFELSLIFEQQIDLHCVFFLNFFSKSVIFQVSFYMQMIFALRNRMHTHKRIIIIVKKNIQSFSLIATKQYSHPYLLYFRNHQQGRFGEVSLAFSQFMYTSQNLIFLEVPQSPIYIMIISIS